MLITFSEHGVIKSDSVYNALANTDRKFYTQTAYPYVDSPQSIGFGATISAPHMVSFTSVPKFTKQLDRLHR